MHFISDLDHKDIPSKPENTNFQLSQFIQVLMVTPFSQSASKLCIEKPALHQHQI